MKSKKMFAILTLVAFMMTLLPIAAFGIPYSASGSYITTDKNSVSASEQGAERPIKVTFVARDANGTSLVSKVLQDVYIKADNDAVKVGLAIGNQIVAGGVTDGAAVGDVDNKLSTNQKVYFVANAAMTSVTGAYVPVKTDANGRVTFYVYSKIASNASLKFYNNKANFDGKVLVGDKALSFVSTGSTIKDVYFRAYSAFGVTTITAGNKLEVTAKVYDGSNNGIKDQDVEWFVKKGSSGSYVSLGTIKSDEFGDAKYTVYPTEATSYMYKAKVGDKVYTATVSTTVVAATPVKIEAKDATKYAEINKDFQANFFAYDTFGNKVTDTTLVDWTVTAKPTDSGVEKDSVAVFTGKASDANDKYVYAKFKPDIAGEYTVKAAIPGSGISTTMKVNAGTFAAIGSVKVQMPKVADGKRAIGIKTVNAAVGAARTGGNTKALSISLVDVNGVEKDASETDVILSSSNPDLLKVDNASWNTSGNVVWKRVYGPVNNSKGSATITVIHKDTGKSGSIEIPVIGGASTIAETITVNDKVATIALQLKDSDGKNTFDSEATNTDYDVFVTGATVDAKKQFARVTGEGSFTLTSTDYASKDVTVVMNGGLSKTFKVNFAATPVITGAAKNVTMFIGSKGFTKDGAAAICTVAPFIKDGRTMVEVRAVASAFGVADADIAYANGVVTLKRADVTVTITIGSATITTTTGKTITSDVAAYVTPEGRTVLPIKFIGDAFGYTATYDAATQSVTFVKA